MVLFPVHIARTAQETQENKTRHETQGQGQQQHRLGLQHGAQVRVVNLVTIYVNLVTI